MTEQDLPKPRINLGADNDVYSCNFKSMLDPTFRSDFVMAGTGAAPKFKKKILLWSDDF